MMTTSKNVQWKEAAPYNAERNDVVRVVAWDVVGDAIRPQMRRKNNKVADALFIWYAYEIEMELDTFET